MEKQKMDTQTTDEQLELEVMVPSHELPAVVVDPEVAVEIALLNVKYARVRLQRTEAGPSVDRIGTTRDLSPLGR